MWSLQLCLLMRTSSVQTALSAPQLLHSFPRPAISWLLSTTSLGSESELGDSGSFWLLPSWQPAPLPFFAQALTTHMTYLAALVEITSQNCLFTTCWTWGGAVRTPLFNFPDSFSKHSLLGARLPRRTAHYPVSRPCYKYRVVLESRWLLGLKKFDGLSSVTAFPQGHGRRPLAFFKSGHWFILLNSLQFLEIYFVDQKLGFVAQPCFHQVRSWSAVDLQRILAMFSVILAACHSNRQRGKCCVSSHWIGKSFGKPYQTGLVSTKVLSPGQWQRNFSEALLSFCEASDTGYAKYFVALQHPGRLSCI